MSRNLLSATAVVALAWLSSCNDSPTAPAVRLGAGQLHVSEQVVCALDASTNMWCWGQHQHGEFGVAHVGFFTASVPVAGVLEPRIETFASGVSTHLCGVNPARESICWARGGSGQLGRGWVDSNPSPPAKVAGNRAWIDLAVGRLFTCGVASDSSAHCWGRDQKGEIGTGAAPPATGASLALAPQLVVGGLKYKAITAGFLHTCAITTTDDAVCWGANDLGQLGVGGSDTASRPSPTPVAGGLKFRQLRAGTKYTCGITTANDAYCWGSNGTGQLGDGTTANRFAPTKVQTTLKFGFIATGSGLSAAANAGQPPGTNLQGGVGHTCALTPGGSAFCWGWNIAGQLGDGTTTDRLTPAAVGAGPFSVIGVASGNTCGMRGTAIWCWGTNLRSQLGRETEELFSSVPRRVAAPFDK